MKKKSYKKMQKGGKFLPPVTVYGTRDDETNNALNYLAGKSDKYTMDYIASISGKHLPPLENNYEGIWKSWVDNNRPDIRAQYYANYIPSYNPATNTINTQLAEDPITSYFSELSHAKQMKNKTIQKLADNQRGIMNRYAKRFNYSMDTLGEPIREMTYNYPGTVEHNAHNVIQPSLEKKYLGKVSKQDNIPYQDTLKPLDDSVIQYYKKESGKYQQGGKVMKNKKYYKADEGKKLMGQEHSQSTHEHWLANQLQTNMNPELRAQMTQDSTYAAQQLQMDPNYVPTANKQYVQFIDQNPNSPDVERLKEKVEAYRNAYDTFMKSSKGKGGKYYGGKLKKALQGIQMDGAEPSKLLDNPQGQTPTGQPIGQYGNLYGTPAIPQEVQTGFQQSQDMAHLIQDPVAMEQAKPVSGLPPVTPDYIDQYKEPQPADKKQRKPFNANMHFNTNDIFAGAVQGINALIPQQRAKDNRNPLYMARASQPQGTGSHAAFNYGGEVAKKGKKLTSAKAREILRDGTAQGHKLTAKQKRFFGYIAGGGKADNGAVIPENWQALHAYAYQNDPQYGSQTYNHGQFATPILEAFNKQYPNQAIQPSQIPAYQQYFQDQAAIDPSRVTAPQGLSPVDAKYGPKTQTTNLRSYELVHMRGDKVLSDQKFGPHPEQVVPAVNQLVAANAPKQYPQAPMAGAVTSKPAGTMGGVSGTEYNPYAKQARKQAKQQKSRYFTNEPTNYSVESTKMAMGGSVPLSGNNTLQVDGSYKHLSDEAIELEGPKHSQGGQDIAANGTTVEAEGGEVVMPAEDGSMQVLGNLYMSGTKEKHKDIMKRIQKKSAKSKDKASFLLNNYEAKDKYQGPAFNTGAVLADAHEQYKEQAQHIIDDNNLQLEMADYYGVDAKKVTNDLKGKAKYGKKMYYDGGYMSESEKEKQRRRIGAQRASTPYLGPTIVPKVGVTTSTHVKKPHTSVTTQLQRVGTPSEPYDPMNPFFVKNNNISRNQPGIPDSFPQQIEAITLVASTSLPTGVDYKPQEMTPPELPAPIPTNQLPSDGSGKGKKPYRGLRNRFSIGDYLGEISTLFDTPDPVQSQQARPILEDDYSLSFQNEKNSIISAYNSALKGAANNPAVQAGIAGQMAEQLANVDAKEQQFNDQNRGQIRARNLQELRGVRDVNMRLDEQKQERQDMAKAITKENRVRAAESIGTKEAQRRYQNNTLRMQELGYGWVINPTTGKYEMIKPGYEFNAPTSTIMDPNRDYKKTTTKKSTPRGPEYTDKTEDVLDYYGGKMFTGGMMNGLPPNAGTMAMRGPSYMPGKSYRKKKKKSN